MFEFEYVIPESEVEARYNHVHHATTLRILELARLAFVESIGYPNDQLIERGLFLVIASLSIKYKRELFLAEKVVVTCENCRIEGKSLFIEQQIKKERDRAAVEALVELKCMSEESRRAIVPDEEFLAAFVRN